MPRFLLVGLGEYHPELFLLTPFLNSSCRYNGFRTYIGFHTVRFDVVVIEDKPSYRKYGFANKNHQYKN